MNRRLSYLTEPGLEFGYGQRCEDPRDGLTLFGPYEQFSGHSVQAGVVGTRTGLDYYRSFVSRVTRPILSTSIQRPMYPGFEAVFGLKWLPKPALFLEVRDNDLARVLEISSLQERIYRVVNLYLEPIKRALSQEETAPNIWYVVVPRSVWLKCRPESEGSRRLRVSDAMILAHRAGQSSFLEDVRAELSEASQISDYHSDFHHQLKARLLKDGVVVPVQVMNETTLQFKDKYREKEYSTEMQAHLAWTATSSMYYKLGKLPWKLKDIRRGVCYVGMVFKKYERFASKGFVCSAAQMFLDSGDGTVFRGNVGPWESRARHEFHLDRASSRDLLAKALRSYLDRQGSYPEELFIHGRAAFSDEEWTGFLEASYSVSPGTRLVGVVVKETQKLKLFRDVTGEDSKYGNLRGLAWTVDDRECYLWSRGFVPRLATSMSLEIPNPLRITIVRGSASIDQVAQDILALTKLNYNACVFGDGLPVTVRFSDVVGSILTSVDVMPQDVLPFKYYI